MAGNVVSLRAKLARQAADGIGTESGERAIHLAAMRGHLNAVKVLVEHGAVVFRTNDHGMTCLHFAAGSGNLATVEYFLQAGIPIDAQNDVGWTPAFSVASAGHDQLIRWLAQRGADVVSPSHEGMSPVHMAAHSANTARLLIEEFGGNPTAPNGSSRTPLHLAALSGNDDLALWLYAQWPEAASACDDVGDTLLHAAAYGRCSALLRTLIADGLEVNARNDVQATPLMAAQGRDAARALIEAGADVHAVDDLGSAALHSAYAHRRFGVMRVLLRAGANAAAMNNRGESVITLAAK